MTRCFGLVAVFAVLSACSFGPSVIPAKTVSHNAETQLRKQNPQITKGTMKCPELLAEVGTKIRCVRSAHIGIWNATIKGTVTVTKVKDSHADFDIKMDKHIATYAADRATNEDTVARGFDVDKKQVSCPDPISGKVGATGYCVGTDSDGTKHKIKLKVTSSDFNGYEVNYDMKVVD
jgi:hypothetical protein